MGRTPKQDIKTEKRADRLGGNDNSVSYEPDDFR